MPRRLQAAIRKAPPWVAAALRPPAHAARALNPLVGSPRGMRRADIPGHRPDALPGEPPIRGQVGIRDIFPVLSRGAYPPRFLGTTLGGGW